MARVPIGNFALPRKPRRYGHGPSQRLKPCNDELTLSLFTTNSINNARKRDANRRVCCDDDDAAAGRPQRVSNVPYLFYQFYVQIPMSYSYPPRSLTTGRLSGKSRNPTCPTSMRRSYGTTPFSRRRRRGTSRNDQQTVWNISCRTP
jgi:hypothetical protein